MLLEELAKEAVKDAAGDAAELALDQTAAVGDLVGFILGEIQNSARQLAGRPRTARFSPRVVRLSLGLWMRSPAAYKVLQDSGLMVVPSASTLKRLKAKVAVSDGLCPEVFSWLGDAFVSRERSSHGEKGLAGHLMCDEIKIKSGVAWNTATHEAVGLVGVEGKVELQDDLRAILRGATSLQEATATPALATPLLQEGRASQPPT